MPHTIEHRPARNYLPVDSRPSLESVDRVRYLWEAGERSECTALLACIPGVRSFVSHLEPIYGSASVSSHPLFASAVRAAHCAVAKLGIDPLTEEAVRRGFPVYVASALAYAPWLLLQPRTIESWRLGHPPSGNSASNVDWDQTAFPFDRRTVALLRLSVLRRTVGMPGLLRLRADIEDILYSPIPHV